MKLQTRPSVPPSNESDHLDSGIDGSDEEEEKAQVTEGASHAVLRVAGVVAQSVGDASQNPHQTGDGGVHGALETRDKQENKKLRVVLKRVLMRALDAVEDGVLVRIHLGIRNIELLPRLSYADSFPHEHDDGCHGDQNDVTKLGLHLNGDHFELSRLNRPQVRI